MNVYSSPVIYSSPTAEITSEVIYRKVSGPKASTRKAADVSFGPVTLRGETVFLEQQNMLKLI